MRKEHLLTTEKVVEEALEYADRCSVTAFDLYAHIFDPFSVAENEGNGFGLLDDSVQALIAEHAANVDWHKAAAEVNKRRGF